MGSDKKDKKEKKEKKDKKEKKEKKEVKEQAGQKRKAEEAKEAPAPKKEKKEKKDKKEKKEKKDKKEKKEKKVKVDLPGAETEAQRKGNDWTEVKLGTEKRTDKFQKLMGAHRHHDDEGAAEKGAHGFFKKAPGKVERDRNGDLFARVKGDIKVYAPAEVQKQSHDFHAEREDLSKIEQDLLKQDQMARQGKKSRGKGLGFATQQPATAEFHQVEGKPLAHTLYNSDEESEESSSSSS